jgi:hypothetical protein
VYPSSMCSFLVLPGSCSALCCTAYQACSWAHARQSPAPIGNTGSAAMLYAIALQAAPPGAEGRGLPADMLTSFPDSFC